MLPTGQDTKASVRVAGLGVELNKDLGRGAGEGAKLPPRIVWPPKAAAGAEVMDEVDGLSATGDVELVAREIWFRLVVEGGDRGRRGGWRP